MKYHRLLAAILLFFLLVNTSYYWEGFLGLFAFPAFAGLAFACLALAVAAVRQLYLAVKEKFSDRRRLVVPGLAAIVLPLAFYKPAGLIDFGRLEGPDVLVAAREGAAIA